jgi:hypothetical protein
LADWYNVAPDFKLAALRRMAETTNIVVLVLRALPFLLSVFLCVHLWLNFFPSIRCFLAKALQCHQARLTNGGTQ